jgi:anti-sigma B factor antagonist
MPLEYIDWERNGVLVFILTGRITLGDGTRVLRKLVEDTLEMGKLEIVLNLREVVHIDSSGLGELVTLHQKVASRGGHLKLANLTSRTYELVNLTKLYTIFEIFPTEDEAVASFGQPRA